MCGIFVLCRSSANAVTIHPAAGGGQVPRQPARLKSAPPEGSAAPGRFFMRPAVGVRGSFAVRGSWIAGIVFYLLFFPARFKSGRPHHIPYPVTGTTRAHGGPKILGISCFGLPPGAAGVYISAPVWPEAPEGCKACAPLFFVLRGGDYGKPAYRPAEKENCCRLS